eukprot:5962358-Amphidinium_carterae.1
MSLRSTRFHSLGHNACKDDPSSHARTVEQYAARPMPLSGQRHVKLTHLFKDMVNLERHQRPDRTSHIHQS